MRAFADKPELVTGVTEEFVFAVEFSPAALTGIGRRRARALFGKKTKTAVHVLASRPFPFPWVSTNGYSLAGEQEAELERLLRSCESDAGLRGMIPVGWYVPRAGRALGAGDEVLFDRFFPEPWQIALIDSREGVFYYFRGLDGDIRSELFPIAPAVKRRWRSAGACAAAVLLAVLLLLLWRPAPRHAGTAPARGAIGLRVSDKTGQLHIRWERSAEIEAAAGAELEIEDGGGRALARLDRIDLLAGSVFYSRWSGNVTVRMALELRGLPPVEEMVTFAAPMPAPVTAHAPPPPQVEDAPPMLDIPIRVSGEAERPEPPRAGAPKLRFRAPRAGVHLPAEPVMDAPALAVVPPPARPLPLAPLPLAPRPRPVPLAERRPEPRPTRGQLIWAGRLERRGVVEIEGGRATAGYVSGTLPQAPANITVLPGELTSTGLRLYTANSRLANRVEPAGPQNGWNRTEYVWDPLRAKEISVLEAPGRHNDWNHLALRAEDRGYSVVVVQWQALP